MDLLVIRHGQSEADVLNVIEGRADFPLTDLGHAQAEAMAKWVNDHYKITSIVCSTLQRARQTAEYLSRATGVNVVYDDDLMEWQNGLIAGLTRAEADTKYPAPPVKFPHTKIYGQESEIEFRARAEHALSRILNENPSDSVVAVVSHGGMINMLYRSFLGLPLHTNVFLASGDTGIHHWRVNNPDQDNRRTMLFSNRQEHLKGIEEAQ